MTYIDKEGKEHEIDVNNPSPTKTYKVVADEFLMATGADFMVLAEEKDFIEHFTYDKDYLVCEYLKKHNQPIVIEHAGRIDYEKDE